MNMALLFHFFQMGGYGFYVWGAYGCVFCYLFIQWYVPWRRWQRYIHRVCLPEQMTNPEVHHE